MRYEAIAVMVFLVVAVGGLSYLFISLTDGINDPVVADTGTQTDVTTPAAGLIVEQDAPIVLGSPSITTNEARDEIRVDFFECIAGNGVLGFESGTVSFEMSGIEGNDCVVSYSSGGDDVFCRIPKDLGTKRFTITDEVPDLRAIDGYCERA